MDDFIKDIAQGEPYRGPYKANKMVKLTKKALIESLSPIFHQIKKAAKEGKDFVYIKEELSDDQRWILENYNYTVLEFDEDEEEYEKGSKLQIQWGQDEEHDGEHD
jgi:hypothetical protein